MTTAMSSGGAPAQPPLVPELPELQSALACFDRGDFRGTKRALATVLASHPKDEVQVAARALLLRMAPDPWAWRVGAGAGLLLLLTVWLYVL